MRNEAARRARAGQILDAAAELLLRLGYRRTTIDDVARLAGVGKGTVYLHWRTREQLFDAVFQREATAATMELLAAMREDPELVLLHRLTRFSFGTMLRRPLLRALFTGDLEVLGKLARNADVGLAGRQDAAFKDYLRLLAEYGLIHTMFDAHDLFFVYQSISAGFFVSESLLSPQTRVPAERMVELLAATVRRTFESEGTPPVAAVRVVATRVIEIFQEVVDVTHAYLEREHQE